MPGPLSSISILCGTTESLLAQSNLTLHPGPDSQFPGIFECFHRISYDIDEHLDQLFLITRDIGQARIVVPHHLQVFGFFCESELAHMLKHDGECLNSIIGVESAILTCRQPDYTNGRFP